MVTDYVTVTTYDIKIEILSQSSVSVDPITGVVTVTTVTSAVSTLIPISLVIPILVPVTTVGNNCGYITYGEPAPKFESPLNQQSYTNTTSVTTSYSFGPTTSTAPRSDEQGGSGKQEAIPAPQYGHTVMWSEVVQPANAITYEQFAHGKYSLLTQINVAKGIVNAASGTAFYQSGLYNDGSPFWVYFIPTNGGVILRWVDQHGRDSFFSVPHAAPLE